jgi:hypothetical protein
MTNPAIADFVDVTYPPWITDVNPNLDSILQFFRVKSHENNNWNLRVADILKKISPPATNVNLGSVQVQGKTRGWTELKATVNRMDDDDGFSIPATVVNGIIRVGPPGSIQVNSTPKGAKIFINGTDQRTTTNATIPGVPVGMNTVSVCCVTNYADPKPVEKEVISGDTVYVFFKLYKPGKMAINSTPVTGANITIDGKDTGKWTNNTFTGQRPDNYLVNVSKPGYYNQSTIVNVTSLTLTTVNFVLVPVDKNDVPPEGGPPYGTMIITSSPRGAQVIKDGVPMDWWTNTSVNMPPGDYTITVKLEGYQTPAPVKKSITYHNPTTWFFQLEPALPAKVLIVPRTLNIGRGEGKFLAFVRLPEGYKASNVDAKSVFCEGAQATRIVRTNVFPRIFAAVFMRKQLVNVEPGEDVEFTVTGTVKGKDFIGNDHIRVISVATKVKEDTDDMDKIKDDEIMKKFMPKWP